MNQTKRSPAAAISITPPVAASSGLLCHGSDHDASASDVLNIALPPVQPAKRARGRPRRNGSVEHSRSGSAAAAPVLSYAIVVNGLQISVRVEDHAAAAQLQIALQPGSSLPSAGGTDSGLAGASQVTLATPDGTISIAMAAR